MAIPVACPSCGARGAVDARAGKTVRCKQCGSRFRAPNAGPPQPDSYALAEPVARPSAVASPGAGQPSAYVAAPGDEAIGPPPTRPQSAPKRRRARSARHGKPPAWRAWLLRSSVVVVLVLAAIALFVPRGMMISGSVLMIAGSLLVLAGYAAGAYGAFSEDFLYGVLYVAIPLYTAYYIVTRFDDLWIWFAGSTAGVLLIALGAALAQWGGGGV